MKFLTTVLVYFFVLTKHTHTHMAYNGRACVRMGPSWAILNIRSTWPSPRVPAAEVGYTTTQLDLSHSAQKDSLTSGPRGLSRHLPAALARARYRGCPYR